MRTIIIEDEALIAKNLSQQLRAIDPNIEVLATLDSVKGAVKWLNEHTHPDILFMDIQLSDGVSFDIFKEVKVERPIVFTTAYNEYAIRAFKVNSIDYLLKPVDREALEKALEKYRKLIALPGAVLGEQVQSLMQTFAQQHQVHYKERFLVHNKGGMVPIAQSEVAYFVKDTIIYLITRANEKLVTDYTTIDELEEVVNPKFFFHANRQTILHIDEVDAYKKHDTGKIEVRLRCDKDLRIDISREKANAFVSWLED